MLVGEFRSALLCAPPRAWIVVPYEGRYSRVDAIVFLGVFGPGGGESVHRFEITPNPGCDSAFAESTLRLTEDLKPELRVEFKGYETSAYEAVHRYASHPIYGMPFDLEQEGGTKLRPVVVFQRRYVMPRHERPTAWEHLTQT